METPLEIAGWIGLNVVVAGALVLYGYAWCREARSLGVRLTMTTFLTITLAMQQEGENVGGCTRLVEMGYPPKVVMAKAEKAARKGYTDYGTNPWWGWITPEGREFLGVPNDT